MNPVRPSLLEVVVCVVVFLSPAWLPAFKRKDVLRGVEQAARTRDALGKACEAPRSLR